jgi:dienelactone hydrolase
VADIILFHHALGLTDGIGAFADKIRAAGHRVTVPDLYDGTIFATVAEGVAHAEKIGFQVIIERGIAAASKLRDQTVYAGFSLGAMPAQKLAQTRPGALAAILYHGAIPLGHFGAAWPKGVALQMHANRHDKWEELSVFEQLARDVGNDAELFVYPGSTHLFTDSSFVEYDEDFTQLALERTLKWLDRWCA